MKTKKITALVLIAAMLFALTISTFAEGRASYSATYTAGHVEHRFDTSNSLVKNGSEQWIQITDNPSYSRYYKIETDQLVNNAGKHTTRLVSGTGKTLTGTKTTASSTGSVSFGGNELNSANSAAAVKLRISKPTDGTDDTMYLKTAGSFRGSTQPIIIENGIPADAN